MNVRALLAAGLLLASLTVAIQDAGSSPSGPISEDQKHGFCSLTDPGTATSATPLSSTWALSARSLSQRRSSALTTRPPRQWQGPFLRSLPSRISLSDRPSTPSNQGWPSDC